MKLDSHSGLLLTHLTPTILGLAQKSNPHFVDVRLGQRRVKSPYFYHVEGDVPFGKRKKDLFCRIGIQSNCRYAEYQIS